MYTGYDMTIGNLFGVPTGVTPTRTFNMTARFHF